MAFWKKLGFGKEEEPEFSADIPPPTAPKFSPLSEGGLEPAVSPQIAPPAAFHPIQAPQMPDPELRVISAKLDTIKAVLDVINQRLDRLEGKKGDELTRWR